MSTKKKKRISTQRRPSIHYHENNENQEANSSKFTEKGFVCFTFIANGRYKGFSILTFITFSLGSALT